MQTLVMRRLLASMLVMAVLGFVAPHPALAQLADEVELVPLATDLVVEATEDTFDLDFSVKNKTSTSRAIAFELEGVPTTWDVAVWHRFNDFKVTRSVISPSPVGGEGERFRLRFRFPEEQQTESGAFALRVVPAGGGAAYDSVQYNVTVGAARGYTERKVTVRSDFPSLSGPAATAFEFEITVDNQTGAERSFDLSADLPQGWDVSFSPGLGQERDKEITVISVPDTLDERVKVRVKPSFLAAAGDYPIPVMVSSSSYEAEGLLRLTIVGRGRLEVSIPDDVRTSFDAKPGEPVSTAVRLINRGGAEMQGIELSADLPAPDWGVGFQVDTVQSLPVDNQIDVGVTVTPPADATPGDYIVTVRAAHPNSRGSIDYRVTVEESSIWRWLGIALGVLAIGGFVGLVLRYGRR